MLKLLVTVRRTHLAHIRHPPPDAEKVFDLIALLRQHVLKVTFQAMSLYRFPVSYPDQKAGCCPLKQPNSQGDIGCFYGISCPRGNKLKIE